MEKAQAKNRAPQAICKTCPNLETTTTDIGRTVLSCQLEKAAQGNKNITAGELKDALDIEGETSVGLPMAVRTAMHQADDGCPLVEDMVEQLLNAHSFQDRIKFNALPSPLVTTEQAENLDYC